MLINYEKRQQPQWRECYYVMNTWRIIARHVPLRVYNGNAVTLSDTTRSCLYVEIKTRQKKLQKWTVFYLFFFQNFVYELHQKQWEFLKKKLHVVLYNLTSVQRGVKPTPLNNIVDIKACLHQSWDKTLCLLGSFWGTGWIMSIVSLVILQFSFLAWIYAIMLQRQMDTAKNKSRNFILKNHSFKIKHTTYNIDGIFWII